MGSPRGLVEYMCHVGIPEGVVQSDDAGTHLSGLFGSHTDPQQVDPFRKGRWISECSVEGCLHIQLLSVHHQQPACTTESADIGEEIEMVEGDMEGLHAAHG